MSASPPFFRTSSFGAGPSVGWLTVPLDLFGGIVLMAMVVLNCVDVIMREIFNAPIVGATELTTLAIPLVVFAALPVVTYREEQISVDLVDLFYPKSAINVRQVALNLITMLLMAGVTYELYLAGADAQEYIDATENLRIGRWYIFYFMSATAGAATLLLFLNLIRYLRNFGPLSPDHADDERKSIGSGA